jgi:hypothetical protein
MTDGCDGGLNSGDVGGEKVGLRIWRGETPTPRPYDTVFGREMDGGETEYGASVSGVGVMEKEEEGIAEGDCVVGLFAVVLADVEVAVRGGVTPITCDVVRGNGIGVSMLGALAHASVDADVHPVDVDE